MRIRARFQWPTTAALFLASSTAAAQPPDVDSIHHRNNCRLAIQTLTTGHPPARFDWAAGYVERCGGDGGRALAQALLDRRYVRPEELGFVVFSAGRVIDRSLFEAALTVAADPSRTPGVRVQAIRVLHEQLAAGTVVDYATYVSESPSFMITTHSEQRVLQPLLLGSAENAISVLTRIRDAPGVDPVVRNAAERARSKFEGVLSFRRRCAEDPADIMCQHR